MVYRRKTEQERLAESYQNHVNSLSQEEREKLVGKSVSLNFEGFETFKVLFPEEPPVGSVVLVDETAYQRRRSDTDGTRTNWQSTDKGILSWEGLFLKNAIVQIIYRKSEDK